MKRVLSVVACLLIVGCSGSAEAVKRSTNSEYNVEVLFTDHDGFTVKRFVDGGRAHHYVTPSGAVVNTHLESQGKTTTTRSEIVPTVVP